MSLPEHFRTEVLIEGTPLEVTLPKFLFRWPNPGQPLRICVSLRGHTVQMASGSLFRDSTEGDVRRLASRVRLVACSQCGVQTFDPQSFGGLVSGLCKSCDDRRKSETTERQQAELEGDSRSRLLWGFNQGYRWLVVATAHPRAGTARTYEDMYIEKPSRAGIVARLKQRHSINFNDYKVVELATVIGETRRHSGGVR